VVAVAAPEAPKPARIYTDFAKRAKMTGVLITRWELDETSDSFVIRALVAHKLFRRPYDGILDVEGSGILPPSCTDAFRAVVPKTLWLMAAANPNALEVNYNHGVVYLRQIGSKIGEDVPSKCPLLAFRLHVNRTDDGDLFAHFYADDALGPEKYGVTYSTEKSFPES
jgi:hypothetical protein